MFFFGILIGASVFALGLVAGSLAIALIGAVITIVLWVMSEVKSFSTPEGMNREIKENKKQIEYENEYGIIDTK